MQIQNDENVFRSKVVGAKVSEQKPKKSKKCHKIEFGYIFVSYLLILTIELSIICAKVSPTLNIIKIIKQRYSKLPKYYHFYQNITIL